MTKTKGKGMLSRIMESIEAVSTTATTKATTWLTAMMDGIEVRCPIDGTHNIPAEKHAEKILAYAEACAADGDALFIHKRVCSQPGCRQEIHILTGGRMAADKMTGLTCQSCYKAKNQAAFAKKQDARKARALRVLGA